MGLPELQHLIYQRFLRGLGMLVYFTNLTLTEFQIRYLSLFLLFSKIDGFGWFWMGSFHNIQLILEFVTAPFLALPFFYSKLIIFLMMLSVILLYVLMILLYSLFQVWSGIWSMETTTIGLGRLIWSTRHCGLRNEVACWFQCWKIPINFV